MTQLARSIAEAKIAIDEGNKMTEGVKKNTDVFVTWVKNVTGFNNVVNLVFSVLIKASIVVVAAGILWYFVTERQLPRKAQAPVATEHHG